MTLSLLAKPAVEKIESSLRGRIQTFFETKERRPKLAVILVGEDPASLIYTQRKAQAAEGLGIEHATYRFPKDAHPSQVLNTVHELNQDARIDGILIQRPLPERFDLNQVATWIRPDKDVDAFHPLHAGNLLLNLPGFIPCTPHGILALLKYYEIEIAGRLACIIGRSPIVGRPLAPLLLREDATVLQCHRKTKRLKELTNQADLLIVASGIPQWIDRSYVKPGAVIIDVGIHRDSQNQIVGDVSLDVMDHASALSPVPGGVGPMTIAMLLQNTLLAAELHG